MLSSNLASEGIVTDIFYERRLQSNLVIWDIAIDIFANKDIAINIFANERNTIDIFTNGKCDQI